MPTSWHVLVPVKPLAVGKTRLQPVETALSRAIVLDSVTAAVGAERVATVVVVTADADVAAELGRVPGVRVVAEEAPTGIAAAITAGLVGIPIGEGRAVLLGDLPALRAEELDAALALAEDAASADHLRAFVPDAEGTGTTLVTASPGVELFAAFGDGSALRHRLAGLWRLHVDAGSGLRRDVDTAEQLAEAAALGVGPATAAVLAERAG